MKKILTLCAAIVAAMTLSAQEATPMTCADAAQAALALDDGATGTELVVITGYVTVTDGTISRGQQTFWMDDQKGSAKTFQSYWGNLPTEDVENNNPLNVGDQVSITGYLMRYGNTPEMKNGTVVIIERTEVRIDTFEVSVCEAIEEGESLQSGDNTTDVFIVETVVSSLGQTNDTYHNQSFFMQCEDANATLQAYNVTIDKDEDYARLGDSVRVTGRLKKYGEQVEILGACEILWRAEVVTPDTINANVATAVEAGSQLAAGTYSNDIYVVAGYVDSIVTEYSDEYKNMSFFMCDDLNAPDYLFEAYRCTSEDIAEVGDRVIVVGNLKNYVKDGVSTIEIEKGAYEIDPMAILEEVMMMDADIKKVIINGQLYIRRDGHFFDAKGTMVK